MLRIDCKCIIKKYTLRLQIIIKVKLIKMGRKANEKPST